jgi:predicted AlkP superfamily phosphohydrolase/phosphomutase
MHSARRTLSHALVPLRKTAALLGGALALGAGLLLACAPDGGGAHERRVLVIGIDGLEWDVLAPLLAEGRCPNLRALAERGSFGRLETIRPTFSPVIWTTIATGRPMQDHGIRGFVDEEGRPYTSTQRAVPALWNVASERGVGVGVFGWWVTWPVEELRGVMVSASAAQAQMDEGNWKPTLLPGVERQVFPQALEPAIFAAAERAGAPEEVRRIAREHVFGVLPDEELGPVERELVRQTLWSIQSDRTYATLATSHLRERPTELTLVYLGTPDVAGHRFWRYREPARYRWPADSEVAQRWAEEHPEEGALPPRLASPAGERALAGVVDRSYEWADVLVGELVAAAGEGATVVVLSDHGMHADFTEYPHHRWLSGHHFDAPPGVLIAAGPGIARAGDLAAALAGGEVPAQGSVLAVAPALLALVGLPSARDLPRQAWMPLLAGEAREVAGRQAVESWSEGFRAPYRSDPPREMEENFRRRFGDLGYVGADEEPPAGAPLR